jgi:hypothetical protein
MKDSKEGLSALVKATEKRRQKPGKTATKTPSKTLVKSNATKSAFNKVALTQSEGPKLRRSRVAENPTVVHPKTKTTDKTARKKSAEPRERLAASTKPGPEPTAADAKRLMSSCETLLSEFQEVARSFQTVAAGRREGAIYEAWRDLNHAQILLYRSMSVLREGYGLAADTESP